MTDSELDRALLEQVIYAIRIAKRDINNWYSSKEAAKATIAVLDSTLALIDAKVGGSHE